MMDETSLVYVVLEPTEADLSQILCERPLTLAETRQVAASLIPALQALHAKGFIHEHIQPANVLAVGEVVKLRSDCIREAPEGLEGEALRVRDVQDLATLLLHALTQQRSYAMSSTGPSLPAPFREIVSNGISGTWGLTQMAAALEATDSQAARHPAVTPSTPLPTASTIQQLHRPPVTVVEASQPAVAAAASGRQSGAPRKPVVLAAAHRPSETSEGRIRVPLREQAVSAQRWLVLLALAVLGMMLFAAYNVLHRHSSETTAVSADPPVQSAASAAPVSLKARDSWRVVAYTYNRQDQAVAKARSLEQRFGELNPSVFTPTGRAPFLITMGGPLSRDAAFSLRDKLRRSGLPRDLYAQNYKSKAR